MAVLVGTSGWQYDDWRGRFYPAGLPKRAWLAFFATRFPTVEINNSFYRLPSPEAFGRWRDETPEGFVVALKASRFITHVRRMRDCRDPVHLLWTRAMELGPRLGPVLFQFPPRFPADLERLKGFLPVLPRAMRAAFEFRDPSWETDEVLEALHAAGAAFVLADRPRARVRDVVTGGWAYIRFHQGRQLAPGYNEDQAPAVGRSHPGAASQRRVRLLQQRDRRRGRPGRAHPNRVAVGRKDGRDASNAVIAAS